MCLHNMANFGWLAVEIGSGVWGTLYFNGFGILPSLLQRRRSPEANQTLHDAWTSPALAHYIYILGGSCPWRNFAWCKIHFTSKSCVLLYWQRFCTALQQRASAKVYDVVHGMEFRDFRRGRHLYSAGRPSRWASAHILVTVYSSFDECWRHFGLSDVFHCMQSLYDLWYDVNVMSPLCSCVALQTTVLIQ